jgi:hypothetical protein
MNATVQYPGETPIVDELSSERGIGRCLFTFVVRVVHLNSLPQEFGTRVIWEVKQTPRVIPCIDIKNEQPSTLLPYQVPVL